VIEFDQDMLAPTNIIPSIYQRIIIYKVKSVLDGSTQVGRLQRDKKRSLEEEDEYDNSFVDDSEAA